jgi:2-dehydropantoate 2-reductase
MKIAIIGAGGVGGYYAGVLARAGHDVRVLARGDNLATIAEQGLHVDMPEGGFTVPVRASDDASRLLGADAAIIAVKSYSLESIAPAARAFAAAGAFLVPLLNGVDAADRLAAAGVPEPSLLGGLTYISAVRSAPGRFQRRSPFARVIVGELAGAVSERAERLAGALRDAGVDARADADVMVELWRKLIFLASIAGACGLARADIGSVRDARLGLDVLRRAVDEGVAVARARGVALPEDQAQQTMAQIAEFPAAVKPSLVLDVEAGRTTEIDVLSGAIAAMGRAAGIATPFHDVAAAAIEAATAGAAS